MLTAQESEDVSDPVFTGLFEESFTPEEKIPFENIKRTFGRGGKLTFYLDKESFIGFTYCFEHPDAVFLVYFATEPDRRNSGYG